MKTKNLNERADDYVKAVASEVGKRAKTSVKSAVTKAKGVVDDVVSSGKEIVDAGRTASFDRDFEKQITQLLKLVRDLEDITFESVSTITYHELLMEMDVERPMVEAAVRYQMYLREESELNEAWFDFIKGAGAKAKEKLSNTKGKVKDAAKEVGEKVKRTWNKAKEVYKEIDDAGRQASATADSRRTEEAKKRAAEKRYKAAEAKTKEVETKISKVAAKVADLIAKREQQIGKPIQQHPTLTKMVKTAVQMSDFERKQVLSAISKARRAKRQQ